MYKAREDESITIDSLETPGSMGQQYGQKYDPQYTTDCGISMMVKRLTANRCKRVMEHPQALGNSFDFKEAIEFLGMDWRDIYKEGWATPNPDIYTDMSYMYSLQGPPDSALKAMREKLDVETIWPYPPDLLDELRELVAKIKFKRDRGPQFEVIGCEGAQGGIGFTFLGFLNEGDEVLVPDPGYMHFSPGPNVEGATVRPIVLRKENNYRIDPDEFRDMISHRTKMLVLCDPINPFGTVQSKESLLEIAKIAWEHDIVIFNNITHSTHQTNPQAHHFPLASLYDECEVDHVIGTTGMSKGYGMAAVRIGFMAGHPDLLKGPALIRMEIVKRHLNLLGQYGAIAALQDYEYVNRCTENIRRNYAHIKQTVAITKGVSIPVEPDYGFCMIIDVADTGVSAQELTVGLFKYKVAVVPGDALGDEGATRYIRLNYSARRIEDMERFREVLPVAIEDAKKGIYKDFVINWFKNKKNPRARHIVQELINGSR